MINCSQNKVQFTYDLSQWTNQNKSTDFSETILDLENQPFFLNIQLRSNN